MGVPARGVQEIRTLASVMGSGAHSSERHVRQFQLASLELERTRRIRERKAALSRLRDIDARLAEIEELIEKHQEALGLRNHGEDDEAEAEQQGPVFAAKRRVLKY